jgi:hypothetical protein
VSEPNWTKSDFSYEVVKLFLHLLSSRLAAKLIKGINAGAFEQEYSLKLLVTCCVIFDLGINSYGIFGLGIILVTSETQCDLTLVSLLRSQDTLGADRSTYRDRSQNALGAGGSNLREWSQGALGANGSAVRGQSRNALGADGSALRG